MMKFVKIFAVFYIVNLLLAIYHPWTKDWLLQMAALIPIGILLYGAGWGVAKAIGKIKRKHSNLEFNTRHPMMDGKLWALLIISILILYIYDEHLKSGYNILLLALVYYSLIFLSTILLCFWAKKSLSGPLIFILLLFLSISIFSCANFLLNPNVDFRFGPEKIIFALGYQIQRNNLLALDLGLASFTWYISTALRHYKIDLKSNNDEDIIKHVD